MPRTNIIYENNFRISFTIKLVYGLRLPHSGSVIKHQTFILNVAAATEKLGREFPRRKYYVMRCERHKCKNSIFQNAKKVNFPQFYVGNAVVSGGDMCVSLTLI